MHLGRVTSKPDASLTSRPLTFSASPTWQPHTNPKSLRHLPYVEGLPLPHGGNGGCSRRKCTLDSEFCPLPGLALCNEIFSGTCIPKHPDQPYRGSCQGANALSLQRVDQDSTPASAQIECHLRIDGQAAPALRSSGEFMGAGPPGQFLGSPSTKTCHQTLSRTTLLYKHL